HLFQQVVVLEQRVGNDRQEGLAFEPLDDGAAEQCLAGADLAGDDDDRLAALECVGDVVERGRVRRALEPKSGVRREAERRLLESEERLIALRTFARAIVIHETILPPSTFTTTMPSSSSMSATNETARSARRRHRDTRLHPWGAAMPHRRRA